MANNFQSALIVNVSLSKLMAEDPEFGSKLAKAIDDKLHDATASGTVEYEVNGHMLPAVRVVTVHPANMVNLVASGGNTGVDLGSAGAVENMKPENIRELLQAGAQNYGLVVRSEASERDVEAKKLTAEKAKATREATKKRQIEEAARALLASQGKLPA
jgi:hypothetical protein